MAKVNKTNKLNTAQKVKLDGGPQKKRVNSDDTPAESKKKIKEIEKTVHKKPRLDDKNDKKITEKENTQPKKVLNKKEPVNSKADKIPIVDNNKNGKVSKPYKANVNNGFNKNKTNGKTVEKLEIDKKELKKQRRMKKLSNQYELNVDMKKIWETLRKSDTTDEVRQKLCRSLHERIKGNVKNMVYAHDTVRVMQCFIEYGNELQRETVFNELKEEFVALAKSQYARFVLEKFLNYGTKEQKDYIINCFIGNVTKLIKHSFACKIVESIFNEHADKNQRNQMLNEFYGVPLTDKVYSSLGDYINENANSKDKILLNLKDLLQTCIEKSILMFSVVHRAFVEYLKNCDQKMKAELIDALAEHLVHIVHTRDGSQVAMQCIWFSTAKQRKILIKSFKSFIKKIACEEHGHQVLLAIFDSVDDTKFVSKLVLDELFRSIDELFANDYGRKVLTYLIAPRDTRFFIKTYVKQLEYGDQSETSKKSPDIRRNELCSYSIKFVYDYINKKLNELLTNGATGILIPEIILKLDDKLCDEILIKLAGLLLSQAYEKNKEHLIENATAHYIIKHIIVNDKSHKLVDSLLDHSNSSNMKTWCECNRGCFTLVKMFEACDGKRQGRLKEFLNEKDLLKNLKGEKFSGANVLLDKLNNQIK